MSLVFTFTRSREPAQIGKHTKQSRDEGLADNVDGGDVVYVEVGALPDRALHHRESHAHEGAGDGQLLLLSQLDHEVLQPRKGAVHNLHAAARL